MKNQLNAELLNKLYWEERLSCMAIAQRLNVTQGCIEYRMRKFGIQRRSASVAANLSFEEGRRIYKGRWIDEDGRVRIPVKRGSHYYKYEHILVWEQVHGKSVPRGWDVHHLNGIKNDNRPENLVALPKKRHGLVTQLEPYKTRIRTLEAKVKLLERVSDSQQMIWWSDN